MVKTTCSQCRGGCRGGGGLIPGGRTKNYMPGSVAIILFYFLRKIAPSLLSLGEEIRASGAQRERIGVYTRFRGNPCQFFLDWDTEG